jgi:hypothetical protein
MLLFPLLKIHPRPPSLQSIPSHAHTPAIAHANVLARPYIFQINKWKMTEKYRPAYGEFVLPVGNKEQLSLSGTLRTVA